MAKRICTECGSVGEPRMVTPGSLGIEIVLWCFLGLGIFYSIWRHAARHPACPACGGKGLIPPNSPKGRSLLAQLKLPSAPSFVASDDSGYRELPIFSGQNSCPKCKSLAVKFSEKDSAGIQLAECQKCPEKWRLS